MVVFCRNSGSNGATSPFLEVYITRVVVSINQLVRGESEHIKIELDRNEMNGILPALYPV